MNKAAPASGTEIVGRNEARHRSFDELRFVGRQVLIILAHGDIGLVGVSGRPRYLARHRPCREAIARKSCSRAGGDARQKFAPIEF
jgi:hypothetical protein